MRAAWMGLLAWLAACHVPADGRVATADLEPYVECPASTSWNGEVCVWRYVITDVRCPQLTVWDGTRCVSTHVSCPEGAAWEGERCVPIGQRPADDTEAVLAAEETPATDPLYTERAPLPRPPVDAFNYR